MAGVLVGIVVVLVLCALAVAWRRAYRRRLAHGVACARGADAFAELSLRQFEIVVGDAFRSQGYHVRDLQDSVMELWRDGEVFLVECSHWKDYKVPVAAVRELYSAIESREAAGAFIVTSGAFTEDAKAFVQGTEIHLVDGRQLFDLIQRELAAA